MTLEAPSPTQPPLDAIVSASSQLAKDSTVSGSPHLRSALENLTTRIQGKDESSVSEDDVAELTRNRDELQTLINQPTLIQSQLLPHSLVEAQRAAVQVKGPDVHKLIDRAIREVTALVEKRKQAEKEPLPEVFERAKRGLQVVQQKNVSEDRLIQSILNTQGDTTLMRDELRESFSHTHEVERAIALVIVGVDTFLQSFRQAAYGTEVSQIEARNKKLEAFEKIKTDVVESLQESKKKWRENLTLTVPSLDRLRILNETVLDRFDTNGEDPNVLLSELRTALATAQNDILVTQNSGWYRETIETDYFQRTQEMRTQLIDRWKGWLVSRANTAVGYARTQQMIDEYRRRFVAGDEEFTDVMRNTLNTVVQNLQNAIPRFAELEQREHIQTAFINPLVSIEPEVNQKKQRSLEAKRLELDQYPISIQNIVAFFEGMDATHGHPEWRNGGWKKANARELARGLIQLPFNRIRDIGYRRHDLYIGSQDLFNVQVQDIGDNPTISGLISSFNALGDYFKELAISGLPDVDVQLCLYNADMMSVFTEQIGTDIGEIEKILDYGNAVKQSLAEIDSIIETIYAGGNTKKQHFFDQLDLPRMVQLGDGYMEEPGNPELISLGDRFGRAFQAILAVNEPIFHEEAVYSAKTKEGHTIFLRGVNESNPLGWFPEENTENGESDLRFVKRLLVQMIAGETNSPTWQTSSDYETRMLSAQEHFATRLFGGPDRSKGNSTPDSLWGRYLRDPNPQKLTVLSFLHNDEKQNRNKGRLAETLASNVYMATLEGGKASAAKMKRDKKTGQLETENIGGVDYPVVDASTGPLGDSMNDRLENAALYRMKVKTSAGGEGSGGPIISVSWIYATLAPYFDRHVYVGPNQVIGHTLKEAFMLANDGRYDQINFNDYVPPAESKGAWTKQVDLAGRLYKALIKRLGIKWNSIVASVPGSEGVTPTYDYNSLEILASWSREAYYLLTRDYGMVLNKWEEDEDYARFKKVEAEFYRLGGFDGPGRNLTPPARPAWATDFSDRQWNDEWAKVVKLNRLPSSKHYNYDARPTKDEEGNQAGKGMARYSTNIHHYFRIASFLPEEAVLTEFEQEVFYPEVKTANGKGEQWDGYLQLKKTVLGFVIINDISVNAIGMSWDDAAAIVEFLSRERWDRRHDNVIVQKLRQVSGQKATEFNGLGIYTEKEAFALLKTAGVNTGIISLAQAYMERVKKLPILR